MNIQNKFIKLIAIGFSVILLSACGASNESPEDVVQKFKEVSSEIESGEINASLSMKGEDEQDEIDLTGNFDIKFNRQKSEDRKADISIKLTGNMKAGENVLSGDLALKILTIADDFYIRLEKLESSDETLQSIQPFVQSYLGKWLHVAKDFIPENVRQLQQKDEATLAKEEQLKQLFIKTSIFSVVKEYGTENVNGHKVYHYGVELNEEGIKKYIRNATIIDGSELSEAKIEESAKIATYLKNAELWIGVKDYYLYKAEATFSGGEDNIGEITVEMEGNDFNKSVKIEEPSDPEEFNPLELLMGYGAMATASTMEIPTDEMMGLDEETMKALKAMEQ